MTLHTEQKNYLNYIIIQIQHTTQLKNIERVLEHKTKTVNVGQFKTVFL